MIECDITAFSEIINRLVHILEALDEKQRNDTPLTPEERINIFQFVNSVRVFCEQYEVDIEDDAMRAMRVLDGGKYHPHAYILALRNHISDELGKRKFMFMPTKDAEYYNHFALFGHEIATNFPKANKEITEAGNCYATGNYTACVFHLMRAVEIGAKAMVYDMKAQRYLGNNENVKGVMIFKKKPVELCDWRMLIKGLNKALGELEKGMATDTKKKARHAFFSEAVTTFSLFKDAWRNPLSHGHDIVPDRKLFLEGETTDIMKSTQHFMRHLAKKVKERT